MQDLLSWEDQRDEPKPAPAALTGYGDTEGGDITSAFTEGSCFKYAEVATGLSFSIFSKGLVYATAFLACVALKFFGAQIESLKSPLQLAYRSSMVSSFFFCSSVKSVLSHLSRSQF